MENQINFSESKDVYKIKGKYTKFLGEKEPGYSPMIVASEIKNIEDCYKPISDKSYSTYFYELIMKAKKTNMMSQWYHPVTDKVESLTYGDAQTIVGSLVKGLDSLKLAEPMNEDGVEGNPIGFLSKNQIWATLMDFAVISLGYITVPLYDSFGAEALEFIVGQVKMSVVFVDGIKKQVDMIVKVIKNMGDSNTIKTIIFPDHLTKELRTAAEQSGCKIYTIGELIDIGKAIDKKPEDCVDKDTVLDKICTIMYTSGSTGMPKGVCLKRINCMTCLKAFRSILEPYLVTMPPVFFDFLPTAHIMGRMVEYGLVLFEGQLCYWRGNIKTLSEEIGFFKPTAIALVPRLLNRMFGESKAVLKEKSGLLQSLFGYFYAGREKSYKEIGDCKHNCLENLLFSQGLKGKVGGRLEAIVTGSAPIKAEVLDNLKIQFGVNIVEGYGMTENTANNTASRIDDNVSGHVGHMVYNCIMRLKDHKELGYTSDNVPENIINGKRVWKGEITMKGGCLFEKYFLNPEANAEGFEDGYFRSGDVGMLDEDGRLYIIDRIKNIFKLQQGEYVSPEAVEKVTNSCSITGQSFLTGNSTEPNTVLVLMPDERNVNRCCIAAGHFTVETENNMSLPEKIEKFLETIKPVVKEQVMEALKGSTLKSFEKPHYIYITNKEMNVDNNSMTPTFKIKRNFAAKLFEEEIKKLYHEQTDKNIIKLI